MSSELKIVDYTKPVYSKLTGEQVKVLAGPDRDGEYVVEVNEISHHFDMFGRLAMRPSIGPLLTNDPPAQAVDRSEWVVLQESGCPAVTFRVDQIKCVWVYLNGPLSRIHVDCQSRREWSFYKCPANLAALKAAGIPIPELNESEAK